jgi:shikimate kinase
MGRVEREPAILLTGMMGSGKSRVGRGLAERLGWPFLDTDLLVQERAGCSISEIFARDGEARFRALERAVLERLPTERTVIALGGGALMAPENRSLARSKGLLLWLSASPECLAQRLRKTDHRPLLAGAEGDEKLERLRRLLRERSEAYASAHRTVTTEGMELDEAIETVLAVVREECAA